MSHANLGAVIAEAWDQVTTLNGYGWAPLTVGWWRGQAFVKMWDWRNGQTTWKPFRTARPEQPNPHRQPFDASWAAFVRFR